MGSHNGAGATQHNQSIVFRSAKLPLSLMQDNNSPHMGSHNGAGATQHNQSIVFRSAKLPLSPLQDNNSPHTSNPTSPLPQVFKKGSRPPPKPILDIEDVRAFIRSKLGPPKPSSTDHSSAKRLHSGVFGIGTMGSAGSDGGYVHLSSLQANEHQGQISSHPSTHVSDKYHHDHPQNGYVQDHAENGQDRAQSGHYPDRSCDDHVQNGRAQPDHSNHPGGCCSMHNCGHLYHQHSQPPTPLLDINNVRAAIDSFLHRMGLRRHPTTSWRNKMPWHVPRAPFLARGLEWPPDSFESEEARKAYYRKARKRKPFLLGAPPLWTVTAFNLAFFQLLMYNPVQRFFNYLNKLP